MKQGFDDIVAKVKECGRKTVAVSVAQDSAVLEAVKEAKARVEHERGFWQQARLVKPKKGDSK